MEEQIALTHARRDDKTEYGCYEAWCDIDPGCHCCGWSSETSDMDKYGIGIVLYFRFLKYLMSWYFFFVLFSLPALYFSLKGYPLNKLVLSSFI